MGNGNGSSTGRGTTITVSSVFLTLLGMAVAGAWMLNESLERRLLREIDSVKESIKYVDSRIDKHIDNHRDGLRR